MAWTKTGWLKEVEKAKSYLQLDETVIEWTNGVCESKMFGRDTKRTGILLATDKRVVIYISKMVGYELEEFPYNTMSSIEMSKGMVGYSAKFIASGNTTRVTMMSQGNPQAFVEHVRSQIGNKGGEQSPTEDVAAQLERLSDLVGKGLLTQEEFQQVKAKLLK